MKSFDPDANFYYQSSWLEHGLKTLRGRVLTTWMRMGNQTEPTGGGMERHSLIKVIPAAARLRVPYHTIDAMHSHCK
jgi:hypothetical protein